jgi:O-antigen ligase
MIIQKIKEMKMSGTVAVLLAFFMPLFPKLLPALLVLLFLSLAFEYKKLKYHSEFKVMTWLFALTYLFYVFGLLSSTHIPEALFKLELKLSFLLLPLFFLFHGSFHVNVLRRIFFAFVFGCFINTFFSFYQAYQCFLEKQWWECFFTGFLSFNFHTTYLAIYFCFSILIMVYFLINYYSRLNKWTFLLVIFLIMYFSGFVVMLSSKGGLIALGTVLFVSAMYFFYKRGNFRNTLFILSGLAAMMFLVLFTSDYAKIRVKDAFKMYGMSKEELFRDYKESTESTAVRLMIWDVAENIISDHPLGVGSGDSQSELMKQYEKRGMTGALNLKLNCHNQYYETTLAIGIQGLIVLVVFLLYLVITAFKKRNFLLLWIAIIIIINLFFESMFETQAGVIFFVFFTGLLLTSVPEVIPVSPEKNEKN